MTLQTGVALDIAYRIETTAGTLPTNDSTAKKLRRVSFGLGMKKDAIQSNEIRKSRQKSAPRHAMRKVDGAIQGELSLGTYADFIGSACRRNFAAVSSLSALTNVTAAAAAPQFVRASGSWITDGLRVGMTIRQSGWTAPATANNSKNFTIIALTDTDMTVFETVTAKASGDSVVVSIPGKVTYAPLTGHVENSYSFENYAADAVQSLRFLGNKVTSLDIDIPPNEKASITMNFMGLDRAKSTTQYFTSASAAGTSQMQTGLSASLYLAGLPVLVLTDFKLSMTLDGETKGVVGSNVTPDVFLGSLAASGSFSVLWKDGTCDDYFDAETPVSLVIQLRDTTSTSTDFMNICIPACKLSGGDQPDNEKAIVQNFNFTPYEGDGTSGYQATTIQFQDSLA